MDVKSADTRLILEVSAGSERAVETLEQELRSVISRNSPRLYRILNDVHHEPAMPGPKGRNAKE